ncbi:DinB family protein [Cohnella massiliensis]|uniref:DinB family protein n=1 Tax=Cohnella massiliensis TaxID=1816691 RepID=UPI0009B944FB|nr:DinB family protein [Cohnella massiliensis]
MSEQNGVRRSLHLLLAELIDGPEEGRFTWVLNPGKGNGLLDSLRRLSGAEASAIRIPGRASIAAHANHLRFSLELLNRKSRGEALFADEDWAKSWELQTVTEPEWRGLIARLQDEAHSWMHHVMTAETEWDEKTTVEAIASSAHVAYHFGAIQQLLRIGNPS